MSFDRMPRVVKPGDRLFLNDGLVQSAVKRAAGTEVECVVTVGGELRSRKGLNLPGIDLGLRAFTEDDRCPPQIPRPPLLLSGKFLPTNPRLNLRAN